MILYERRFENPSLNETLKVEVNEHEHKGVSSGVKKMPAIFEADYNALNFS